MDERIEKQEIRKRKKLKSDTDGESASNTVQ